MDDEASNSTRRAYLAALGGGSLAGLAGCVGGLGGGGTVAGCEMSDEPTVEQLPAPVIGNPDADVTVQAFEDFACPHCATYSLDVLPRLREEYVDPGRVRYEFHDFPIPVSEKWSWAVASAARGVQAEGGDEAFFAFAHGVFRNQNSLSYDTIRSVAADSGAPECAVVNDAHNGTYRPVVEADRALAQEMGARGTPTVYVDGRSVRPAYAELSTAIDRALNA